jgi:2-phosphoglycerate kinase
MAKTIVFDHKEKTRVPFLRGILTRSLQDAGLTFSQAYELASTIRTELVDVDEISSIDLRKRVAKRLASLHGESFRDAYLTPAAVPAPVLGRSQDDQVSAFSRGYHVRYLQSCGLTLAEADPITAKVYERLLTQGVVEISSRDLSLMTYRTLLDVYGNKVAKRYAVWAEFQQSGRQLILLIGGTIGSGKSTISTEAAHRLGVVRTQSTDMLREVMRMMIPERLLPVLHTSSFNAWEALPFGDSPEPERLLVEGFQSQAELLSVPCEAVLNRALREKVSMILEGVHVLPSLMDRLPRDDDAIVICLMLAVLSPSELRKRIRGRGVHAPQRRAKRYLKHFESIWQAQSFLLNEADRYEVPIVSNVSKEDATQHVMAVINRALSRQFDGCAEKVFGWSSKPGDKGKSPKGGRND